jgi:uncharacterized protein (TIGR03067 family)
MRRIILTMLATTCIAFSSRAGDEARDALQGVWQAQTLESDGKPAPAEAAKRMRFTFKGDKLLIKGNFADDREEECKYTIDVKATPKQLDFTTPDGKKKILAIYEIKNDEMKVCMRHAESKSGRPTEFATKADSKLVLVVFKRQKD